MDELRIALVAGLGLLETASVSERLRAQLRAAALAALGAVEDEMGVPRSYLPRKERKRRRNLERTTGRGSAN
jgi:hypothetical protein